MNLREQILEESLKLFSLKGFLSTSMNDILTACQTSKGGLYNHFPSKEALFGDCTRIFLESLTLPDPAALARISEPVTRLGQHLHSLSGKTPQSACA